MDKIFAPIKQRILDFVNYKGITKDKFYSRTGISASNFKGIGIRSEIGGDKIVKILTIYPEINPEWLILGKGSMIKTYDKDNHNQVAEPPPQYGNGINKYLETKLSDKEKELNDAYYEIGRLNALVEQLKKDSNKADYAPGTKELKKEME
jgi:hypothetical protein